VALPAVVGPDERWASAVGREVLVVRGAAAARNLPAPGRVDRELLRATPSQPFREFCGLPAVDGRRQGPSRRNSWPSSPELGAVPVTEPAIAGGHGTLPARLYRRPGAAPSVGFAWVHGGAFVGGNGPCRRMLTSALRPAPDPTSNRGRPTCSGNGQWRAGRHGPGHPRPGSLTGPDHPKDQSISVRRLIDLRRGDRCRGAISSDFGREGPRLTSPSRTGDTPSAIDLAGRRWSTG
jgi:hypothetical protein